MDENVSKWKDYAVKAAKMYKEQEEQIAKYNHLLTSKGVNPKVNEENLNLKRQLYNLVTINQRLVSFIKSYKIIINKIEYDDGFVVNGPQLIIKNKSLENVEFDGRAANTNNYANGVYNQIKKDMKELEKEIKDMNKFINEARDLLPENLEKDSFKKYTSEHIFTKFSEF